MYITEPPVVHTYIHTEKSFKVEQIDQIKIPFPHFLSS